MTSDFWSGCFFGNKGASLGGEEPFSEQGDTKHWSGGDTKWIGQEALPDPEKCYSLNLAVQAYFRIYSPNAPHKR